MCSAAAHPFAGGGVGGGETDADGTQTARLESRAPDLLGACPDCGSQLEFAEGCVKCHVCGYSECG